MPKNQVVNQSSCEAIAGLWWFLFAVCFAVLALVTGFLIYSAARSAHVVRPGRAEAKDAAITETRSERSLAIGVAWAAAVTVAVLFVLLIASVWTGCQLGLIADPNALTVEIIGHQWWWEVHYQDQVPSRMVTTANEIHLPVGGPVLLRITSGDVIYSFWAPICTARRT